MKKYYGLVICFIVYFIYGVSLVLYTSQISYIMMVWNVFLGSLCVLFADLLQWYLEREKKYKAVSIILALLWLVFFPNALYMITDFIYVGNPASFVGNNGTLPPATGIFSWVLLVYIGFGCIFTTLIGLDSLYGMQMMITARRGKKQAGAAVLITCLFSGAAIYLGRITRFNSWDVFRPLYIFAGLRASWHQFPVCFSALFSLYILGSYIVYYFVFENRKHQDEWDKKGKTGR